MAQTEKRQKALETAYHQYIKQGGQSVAGDGTTCLYRGTNGSKCAIGALISDKDYDPSMDEGITGVSIDDLWESGNYPQLNGLVDDLGLEFLSELQVLHDSAVLGNSKYVYNNLSLFGINTDFMEN